MALDPWRIVDWGIQLVVALGTLLLAWAAYAEIRESRRERKERARRELAAGVYTPIYEELTPWLDASSQGPDISFVLWRNFRLRSLHLASQVPAGLAALFDELDAAERRYLLLGNALQRRIRDSLDTLAAPLKQKINQTGAKDVQFKLFSGNDWLGIIDPVRLWTTRQTVAQWAERRLQNGHGPGWEVQVLIGGFSAGNTQDCNKLLEQLSGILEKDAEAIENRELAATCRRLGARIHSELLAEVKGGP